MRSLGRAWLRGSLRRPGRVVVIVLGFALMSATTVGALLGGDILDALFLADAEAEWGEVDLEVRADDNAVLALSDVRTLAEEGLPTITAVAPRLILDAAARAGAQVEPGVQLIGLGGEAGFQPLQAIAGTADPPALGVDEAIVNERLAERLDLVVGDQLTLTAAVPRWSEDVRGQLDPVVYNPFAIALEPTVAGIVADTGVADLHRTPNVLMRMDVIARAAAMEGQVTVAHMRVGRPGSEGAEAGVDALAHLVSPFDLDIESVRQDAIDLADEDGGLFRSILLTLSILVVVAAAVAARGLLITLAEERAAELGVLRALGVRRARAAWLLRAEGAAYGTIGAVAGGLAGVPLGRLMARLLADHFASLNAGRGREQVALVPDVDPVVVVTGVLIVAVVAVLTGGSAARPVLAAPVGQVLRGGGPLAGQQAPSARRVLLTACTGALLLGAGLSGGGALVFMGITALLGAWWLSARARVGARERAALAAVDQWGAVLGLVWAMAGTALLADAGDGVQAAFGVLIVGGVTAVLCASALLRTRMRQATRLVRTLLPLGGPQASSIIAAGQADAERRRTTTTMVTLGAVLFMVAALSVLGSAQAIGVARQAGGFDVMARSIAPVPAQDWRAVDGVADAVVLSESWLPQTAYWAQAGDGPRLTVPYPVRIAAPRSRVAAVQDFGLADAVAGLQGSAAAITAVSARPGTAVVDRAALPEGAAVGDDIVIDGGAAPRRLRLIAVLDTYLLSSVIVNEGDLADLADLRGPNRAWIRAEDGVAPAELVASLEQALALAGVAADTAQMLREDVIAVNRTFTDTFALLLVLGLVVAVASVAAHVVRAARERRRQIAVMRSLGLRRAHVTWALAAEPVLAALVGTLLGLTVGLGLLRVLFTVGFSDLAFVVDWGRVLGTAGGAMLLLVLSCTATARATLPRDIAGGLRDLG